MEVTYDPATGSIVVAGVDVAPIVRRVTFDAHVGRQPDVYLELRQGVVDLPDVLAADGVVHVVRDSDDAGGAVAWLRSLEPGMVERALLDDMDMSVPTGEAFLKVLIRMAEDARG